jgi:hypothetical protein
MEYWVKLQHNPLINKAVHEINKSSRLSVAANNSIFFSDTKVLRARFQPTGLRARGEAIIVHSM